VFTAIALETNTSNIASRIKRTEEFTLENLASDNFFRIHVYIWEMAAMMEEDGINLIFVYVCNLLGIALVCAS